MEMTVGQIAALAKLRLSAEEEARAEAEFRDILRFASRLGEGAALPPDAAAQGVTRADEPAACLDRADILRLAPETAGECIAVPKAIE